MFSSGETPNDMQEPNNNSNDDNGDGGGRHHGGDDVDDDSDDNDDDDDDDDETLRPVEVTWYIVVIRAMKYWIWTRVIALITMLLYEIYHNEHI